MKRLKEIIITTRRTGNTSWILNSAYERPDCIVVSKNIQQAKCMQKKYNDLLKTKPWYEKLRWKLFGRKKPKFVPLSYNFDVDDVPVIFDNGAFL
jgi:hypothetical protein